MEFILENLFKFPDSMRRNAVWTLSNMCRGKPSPDWTRVSKMLVPLHQLLDQTKDYDVIIDILWAVSFLSEDREEEETTGANNSTTDEQPIKSNKDENTTATRHIEAILQTGAVKRVINLLKHAAKIGEESWAQISELRIEAARNGSKADENIPAEIRKKLHVSDCLIAPCIRILGNIVSGSDRQTAEVVAAGFYEVIEIGVDHRINNVKKEACWALSNVVAGTANQLNLFYSKAALVKSVLLSKHFFVVHILVYLEHNNKVTLRNLFLKVVNICKQGDVNVRKEAGWCLSNAVYSSSFEQIGILTDAGFIEAMVDLLDIKNPENVLVMAMEALMMCLVAYNRYFHRADSAFNPLAEKIEGLGGVDKLESIQATESVSHRCCQKAATFVSSFWPEDDSVSVENIGDQEPVKENWFSFLLNLKEDAQSSFLYIDYFRLRFAQHLFSFSLRKKKHF
ncbi:karyopherin Cut15 [Reticulomyxa filosa]|uniref:Karyopherin Cut15 n=1 Tax=Reticulomyxa filosa TaxID=46433 RepID=X6MM18_RETFI|nr:karyopherin Cut15 [Reticulomyxa filosa]|eukprot:ETO14482.1 karyopherin Cut15 [Reticulomyxa filosa]